MFGTDWSLLSQYKALIIRIVNVDYGMANGSNYLFTSMASHFQLRRSQLPARAAGVNAILEKLENEYLTK